MNSEHNNLIIETSILIPTHNNGPYLLDTISSILRQDYQNYEIIIIDDHSNDNTEMIIRSLQMIEKRLKYYVNEEKQGLVNALNFGIKQCNGQFIARMDADDTMIGTRLSEQIKFLKENRDFVGVSSSMQLFDFNGLFLGNRIVNSNPTECKFMLLFCNMYVHSAMTMYSSIFKEYKYDKNYKFCEDYDLWCRISKKHKLGNLSTIHHSYRIHNSSTRSSSGLAEQRINVLKLLSKNLTEIDIEHTEHELLIHYYLFNSTTRIGSELEIMKWITKIFESKYLKNEFDQEYLYSKYKYLLNKFCFPSTVID